MAPSDESPDISVVVVSWNTRQLLGRCLDSLGASRTSNVLESIVVDNGSIDGSVEMVQRDYPSIHLIANAANRGFSVANNQGMSASSGRYILLLNSDAEVAPSTVSTLVEYGNAHPDVGVMGPRLVNPDGTLQPSGGRFPTPGGTVLALLGLGRLTRRPRYGTNRDYSRPAVVDEVSGAAMAIRREVVEQIGGLDEAFAWGYEDIDYCWRARKAGWQVHYVPDAVVEHEWGASRKLAPASAVLLAINGRRYYFRKHYGAATSAIVMAATVLSHTLRAAVFSLAGVFDRSFGDRAAVEREILARLRHTAA